MTRRYEDIQAVHDVLGCAIQFSGVRDDEPANTIRPAVLNALTRWWPATEVWLPAVEAGGHEQHNLVGEIGASVFSNAKIHRYLTYTRTQGKSTGGARVACSGSMVLKKLEALACYRTQIEIDELACWPHFIRDQNEYILD
jgi:hypothetical protein